MLSRFGQDRSGMSPLRRTGRLLATLAMGVVLSLATVAPFATPADAAPRAGFGSRGAKTYQAPPATTTAPRTASPIERTQAPRPAQPGATGAQAPGGFMSGLGGSLVKGLLIGGLIGMLLGGGFGGLAGILGLILQVALIAGGIFLVMRLIRGRSQQPASATPYGAGPAPSPLARDGLGPQQNYGGPQPGGPTGGASGPGLTGGLLGSLGGLGRPMGAPQAAPLQTAEPHDDIGLGPQDFESFEKILADMQTAFARADYEALRDVTTIEAFNDLTAQREEMRRQGLTSEIRDVKLLQGDLAEAWREGNEEYATVAMRFEMIDVTRDASGRVVEGDPERPTELTQVWTFYRQRHGAETLPWVLSAMQDVE